MTVESEHQFIINMKLMKLTGLYQLLDPNTVKLFGYNIFKLGGILVIVYLAFVLLASSMSIHYLYDFTAIVKYILTIVAMLFAMIKMYFIIRNSDLLWEFIGFTSIHFLSFDDHRKNILINARTISLTATNTFTIHWIFISAVYIFPSIIVEDNYIKIKSENETYNEFRYNVINLKYPVTAEFYNNNFLMFNLIEILTILFYFHSMIIYDYLIISMCIAITYQLKTISLSYSELGYNDVYADDLISKFWYLRMIIA